MVAKMNVSVRDVDPKVFREFKAKTIVEGAKTGTALTQAMREWIEKKGKKGKTKKSFFEMEPWDWGKGNEKASTEIDKTLYGGK